LTLRAVIIGVIGALLIAGFGYINNHVIHLEWIASGQLIPVSVVGLLLVAMAALNPLLFAVRRRWSLRPAEAATAAMLMMIACSIPGRGLMEQFTFTLAMPAHWNERYPGWQRQQLMSYVPPQMLTDDGQYDADLVTAFRIGMGKEGQPIGLDDVPWRIWRRPLATWLPLILLFALASICLCLVVHRQWTHHERLRYPIAEFTTALVRREPDRTIGPLFRRYAFWLALLAVLIPRIINGLNVWAEGQSIEIPWRWSFPAVMRKWPFLRHVPWGGSLASLRFYPIVIGFSYFLATDISFSLGISMLLYVPIAALLVSYGVRLNTSYLAGGPLGWHRAGAYLAFALIVVYIGRRYYAQALRSALTFRRTPEVERYAAWAMRLLIVALAVAAFLLVRVGLDWPLAILTVGLVMLMFMGVSRIAAETGLFYIHPRWQPLGVLLGLFGGFALGPQATMIIGLVCVVICLDPSQALMPYFLNGLRLCDNVSVRPGRAGVSAMGVYAAGLAVAVVVVLWANYNYGNPPYGWSYQRVPSMSFAAASEEVTQLQNTGALQASQRLSPLERLANINPKPLFLWAVGSGFVLVLVVSLLRLRFTWWPLHPVIFLVWATWAMIMFFQSFLLGFVIKFTVTKLGGYRLYEKGKPLMMGVIAGDILGALVWMIVGAVYYGVTGQQPPPLGVFPR